MTGGKGCVEDDTATEGWGQEDGGCSESSWAPYCSGEGEEGEEREEGIDGEGGLEEGFVEKKAASKSLAKTLPQQAGRRTRGEFPPGERYALSYSI